MESGVRTAGGNPDTPAHPPSAAAIEGCRGCELWRRATHGVPGEGPERGALMLVGEQPGDDEDRVGRPFVGPAGAVLNELLSEAGINRAGVYVTNAVKHFKWEPRGKRRLHRRPSVGEIRACHDWLAQEIAAVLPRVIVALGATAARSLLHRVQTIDSLRQEVCRHSSGAWIYVTYHPSALLRAQADSTRLRGIVLSDLRRAVLQFERLAQEGT